MRSTSLKTSKSPPSSPRRKKIVRFADTLGLDLAAVKTIMQEDLPLVPDSAFDHLDIPKDFHSPMQFASNTKESLVAHFNKVNSSFYSSNGSTLCGFTASSHHLHHHTVNGLINGFNSFHIDSDEDDYSLIDDGLCVDRSLIKVNCVKSTLFDQWCNVNPISSTPLAPVQPPVKPSLPSLAANNVTSVSKSHNDNNNNISKLKNHINNYINDNNNTCNISKHRIDDATNGPLASNTINNGALIAPLISPVKVSPQVNEGNFNVSNVTCNVEASPVDCHSLSLDSTGATHTTSSPWTPKARSTLIAEFIEPFVQISFIEKVKSQSICLENCYINSNCNSLRPNCISVTNCIRVLNKCFEKQVWCRYTTDNWATFTDVRATYIPSSSDSWSDRFTVTFNIENLTAGQRVLFALKYIAGSDEFWDNNAGANYSLMYRI